MSAPSTLPPNLSFMKTPFFISGLPGRCLARAPIGGQMHPNCHSQPPLCPLLIDSCQSPLVGAECALQTGPLPALSVPGSFCQGIPWGRVTPYHSWVPPCSHALSARHGGAAGWPKRLCRGAGPRMSRLC